MYIYKARGAWVCAEAVIGAPKVSFIGLSETFGCCSLTDRAHFLSFTDLATGFGEVWKVHLLVSAAHFLAGVLGIEKMLLFNLI